MFWFRIELCEDGSVHTCVPIAGERNGCRFVFFVRASNKDDAIAKLLERRARRLRLNAERANKVRQERLEKEVCPACGEARDGKWQMCTKCRDNHLSVCAEARARGSAVERTPKQLAELEAQQLVNEKRRSQERVERRKNEGLNGKHSFWMARANLLYEILEEFRTLQATEFENRLEKRIADCKDSALERPHLRVVGGTK